LVTVTPLFFSHTSQSEEPETTLRNEQNLHDHNSMSGEEGRAIAMPTSTVSLKSIKKDNESNSSNVCFFHFFVSKYFATTKHDLK
jgi:ribosomal protein L28